MEGGQLRGIFRRQIGGVKPVDGHGIQHPAKTADVIPVKMGGQRQIQMGHAQLPQEIPCVDPLGTGIQLAGMVVPNQAVMAKIHHHGEGLPPAVQFPDENGIAVAHIDKIQSQHTQSPSRFVALTIPYCVNVYNEKSKRSQPKFDQEI